jgi:flagellar motor switch protein FliN
MTMAGQDDVPLPNLRSGTDLDLDFAEANSGSQVAEQTFSVKGAHDLEQVFDVPVNVSAVLGRTRLEIGELLRLGPGTVLELDRRVGEAIDILVNDRLVARGEVVLVDERLGVTMTEIIKADR